MMGAPASTREWGVLDPPLPGVLYTVHDHAHGLVHAVYGPDRRGWRPVWPLGVAYLRVPTPAFNATIGPASGLRLGWTRERVVGAMLAWHAETGRLPFASEWQTPARHDVGPGGYPSTGTVVNLFGSWASATRAAADRLA